MSVFVFHAAFGDALNLVAKVTESDLDLAYGHTNTINYPWFDLNEMPDVVAEKLTVYGVGTGEGEVAGYRSTSMGDFMVMDGEVYVVAAFGFDKIDDNKTYTLNVDLGAGVTELPMLGKNLAKILNILIVEKATF